MKTLDASFESLDGAIRTPVNSYLSISSNAKITIDITPKFNLNLVISDEKERRSIVQGDNAIMGLALMADPNEDMAFQVDISGSHSSDSIRWGSQDRSKAFVVMASSDGLLTWDSVPGAHGYALYEDFIGEANQLSTIWVSAKNPQFQLDDYNKESEYIVVPIFDHDFPERYEILFSIEAGAGTAEIDNTSWDRGEFSEITFESNEGALRLWTYFLASGTLEIPFYLMRHPMEIEIVYRDGAHETLTVSENSSVSIFGFGEVVVQSTEISLLLDSSDRASFKMNSVSSLVSTGSASVSLYETAVPIETAYINQELYVTDGTGFGIEMELNEGGLKYTAMGLLNADSTATISNYSLRSGFQQWFLRDPMALGINILGLFSLPFVAMPILERWPFWRNPLGRIRQEPNKLGDG